MLTKLHTAITTCRACPRLVTYREEIARQKRRAYADERYWGRPIPGFGDPNGWLLIVGLAPGAHGANRTGRVFTGDRSGDFLYSALHRAGLASQPESTGVGDGLELTGVYILTALRCAPPDNRPAPEELVRCAGFLDREISLVRARVVLALGKIAWDSVLGHASRVFGAVPRPRPKFSHGAEVELGEGRRALHMVGSFHVSQQNTFTGRLTESMFDRVLGTCRALAEGARQGLRPRSRSNVRPPE